MAALLEIRKIAKSFGAHEVVGGVDLALRSGEIIGLVGPNGAGKTTLLNLIAGQFPPSSGRISLGGEDLTALPPHHPKRHALLRSFQNGGVFGKLSALENVALAAVARGQARQSSERAALAALEEVDLGAVAGWRADSLSGGQRKLIDFARLIVTEPRVALLDEPTAGVSHAIMDVMRSLLERRRAAGLAAIIVSHDLPWVFGLCERILVLSGGCVIAEGSPEGVTANPAVQEAYLA